MSSLMHLWDTVAKAWRPATPGDFSGGGGGGGGGGDASAANQATGNASLASIDGKLPSALATDRLKVDGSGVTQPVSAAALPLPSGAATDTVLQAVRDRLPAALVAGRVAVDTGLRGGLTALGYQQITSLSASTALTVPGSASVALIQAEGADVRWRDDGTAPTASVGMLLPAGAELRYTGALAALRLIQASAGAVLNVSYYA